MRKVKRAKKMGFFPSFFRPRSRGCKRAATRCFLNVSRRTFLSNELSLVSVGAPRNLSITTKPVCGKFSRAISLLLVAVRPLRHRARACLFALLVEITEKQYKTRPPWEIVPVAPRRQREAAREYFAMLIAKWTRHFSCTNTRECVCALFGAHRVDFVSWLF